MKTPFELSRKWKSRVYPWRGYGGLHRHDNIEPLAPTEYADEVVPLLRRYLDNPQGDPVLTEMVRRGNWENLTAASPGVLLSLSDLWLTSEKWLNTEEREPPICLLKWLLQNQGVVATLAAWAESEHLRWAQQGAVRYRRHDQDLTGAGLDGAGPSREMRYLRMKLASTSDENYLAAIGLLSTGDVHPISATFLAPTSDELLYRAVEDGPFTGRALETLLAAVSTREQLRRLLERYRKRYHSFSSRSYMASGSLAIGYLASAATAAARIGAPVIDAIDSLMDFPGFAAPTIAELVELQSMCPSAGAFRAVLRYGDSHLLRTMVTRAPQVGLTELSRSGTEFARMLMRDYVRTHSDSVAALMQGLDIDVARTVKNLANHGDHLPESTRPPEILMNPPWLWQRVAAKRPVLDLEGELPAALYRSPAECECVVAQARLYGEKIADAVTIILAADPLTSLPRKLPGLPGWLVPQELPQITMVDGQFGMPRNLVAALVTMCQLGDGKRPYGGVKLVALLCDPSSLAEWAWAIFDQYRSSGYSAKDGWALRLQGWLGNDETAQALSPFIRIWRDEGAHRRATAGLDALSGIGSELALLHLYRISQDVSLKALRARALERVEHIAQDLGLTPEQLGDRLVPDCGLAPNGTVTLDFGPRRFIARLDGNLKPYLTDSDGQPCKRLPKPSRADDETLASAAAKQLSALKKDVRRVSTDQIARLRRAMRYQRRLSAADFNAYFVIHPLMSILVRRLVWGVYEREGSLANSFRVAEDMSFVSRREDVFELPNDATVGVVHPAQCGSDLLETWSEVFAGYELIQPFPQLNRKVYRLTESERSCSVLDRFAGMTIPVRPLLGLTKHGWELGPPMGGGLQDIGRTLPSGVEMTIELCPGVPAGGVDTYGDQTIRAVSVSSGTFGNIDPLLMSELLADLTELERYRT